MDQELNDLKVDIAIIKKDIKQIERFFDKVDHVIDEMAEVTKMLAVQQQLIANFDSKLSYTDQRLADAKKESLEGRLALKEQLDDFKQEFIDDMADRVDIAHKDHENLSMELKLWNEKRHTQIIASLDKVSDEIESRVRKLEQTKWYALGVIGVIVFVFGTGSELISRIIG